MQIVSDTIRALRKLTIGSPQFDGNNFDPFMERALIISKFIGCILLVLTVGFIGSIFFASKYDTFYLGLNKPFFFPPDWILIAGRVIGLLLVGTGLFLVLTADNDSPKDRALGAFGLQVVLNIFWWILTFGVDSDWFGVAELYVLIISVVWMMFEFYRIKPLAGKLIVPYVAWLCYISVLNISLTVLN